MHLARAQRERGPQTLVVLMRTPPWSTTAVTPERTPTSSGFMPKSPVTC
jgi:hypothetical protein